MLILYFYIFQRGFEVWNATFQTSVCVTIATVIVYYDRKIFDITLVVEFSHLAE